MQLFTHILIWLMVSLLQFLMLLSVLCCPCLHIKSVTHNHQNSHVQELLNTLYCCGFILNLTLLTFNNKKRPK